ncbi:hypothetical protein EDD35_3664 [Amycolatopsis thermoflava]|uniref:Uncharacterized protein n=1 Tax=Amycolatopsis thermoflava TaxID=84480 RepID=A0A3N2GYV3_9PSEU|nr:hypothetical protein EDD35_3664 [Amycolatopsis thermoflava]
MRGTLPTAVLTHRPTPGAVGRDVRHTAWINEKPNANPVAQQRSSISVNAAFSALSIVSCHSYFTSIHIFA